MKTAYIVKAYRTAVGKAPKGVFRFKRPDELAAETIQFMMKDLPDFDKTRIDDVMVGNAMPEAEQGLNVGRLISLMGLKVTDVPGVTVNRYCASGLETIGMATAKIQSGMADCIIAGGAESMSFIPMGGYKPTPDYAITKEGHEDYYWGMGLTAEAVAKQFAISREDQDEFSFNSHQKALKAQAEGKFENQIVQGFNPGDEIEFYVKEVKEDNKLTLTFGAPVEKTVKIYEIKEAIDNGTIEAMAAIIKYKRKNGCIVEVHETGMMAMIPQEKVTEDLKNAKPGDRIGILIYEVDPVMGKIFAKPVNV
jgi:acetyl-CoA acetyltransferase